jgi:ferredoxin
MTIYYFTSTGNSLAIAKRIGGEMVSIPQVIDDGSKEYYDDVIGIIFPIYGFFIPKMVRRFLSEKKLVADYVFAIGTYGNLPGACMRNVQRFAAEHDNHVDYAESLLMVDNYLPGFDIEEQIRKLPEKNPDGNLARIITEIESQTRRESTASLRWRTLTALIQVGEKVAMKATQAQNYIVNKDCNQCGTCEKVCPSGNITVSKKVVFADKCEWCLGCVHLCPQNAIHLKNEKSATRWRNPDVSLSEIIAANNRQRDKIGAKEVQYNDVNCEA